MASFEGTAQEFHHYIGPRIRNAVNLLTRKERLKRNGVCEFCGKKATLESAHVQGKERRKIIEEVLKEYAAEGGVSVPDLAKLESEILLAHHPLSDVFKFICKDCHKIYDGNIPKAKGEPGMESKKKSGNERDQYIRELQSVGIATFINYFDEFKKLSAIELTELLMQGNGYKEDSAKTKARNGKNIVNNPVLLNECLEYITQKATRIPDDIRTKAVMIQTELAG